MKNSYYIILIVILAIIITGSFLYAKKQSSEPKQSGQMTFFLTGTNPGKGADLGGLAGADTYCQTIANSVGSGDKVWRAYLSTTATNEAAAVNARDRIGNGPWKNFDGVTVANNLEELHNSNNINKQTALTEKGYTVNGRGDIPNVHDILTGSGPDGRTVAGDGDTTCGNWTKNAEGAAMVGHHDRMGLNDSAEARSWNSSHLSRGCDLEALASSGGRGLMYCFAVTE